MDAQVIQSYGISSYEYAESETKSNFFRIYIGSKDTLKNVNINILDIFEDWYFNRIFRYFLDAQVIQSYGISSYEYAESESKSNFIRIYIGWIKRYI